MDEPDVDEIEESAERLGVVVLAHAVNARAMVDLDLPDGESLPAQECEDIAVHFPADVETLYRFMLIDAERAARVVDIVIDEDAAQEPANAREYADAVLVAPVLAPAGNHVQIVLAELLDEVGDVLGIVLAVAVHGDNEIAHAGLEPGVKGRGLAVVSVEINDGGAREGVELSERAVRTAVVDVDDLVGVRERRDRREDLAVELGDVARFIVDRHNDRNIDMGLHGDRL